MTYGLLGVLVSLVSAGAPGDVGPRVAVGLEGLDRSLAWFAWTERLGVSCPHLLEYTFDTAPTDWRPTAGVWAVASRYACDPTWSFFGGRSPGLACVWNKRRFLGDVEMEAYVAFQYGLPWTETTWLERPMDLCLTLCGDGVEPSSGYSFLFGGDYGARTLLRRGDKVLAATSNPEHLPPSYSDERPSLEQMHWRWFRLLAWKRGDKVGMDVDGKRAFEVADPEPLAGGQVALWTVHNGMMVARVRVGYAAEEPCATPLVRVAEPAPLAGR
ncbi:MAG: hypothetical protein HYU66_13675 [Armatimonadetes bacterium]|nr:hypothetical protein [Armatimonadota bacterium]